MMNACVYEMYEKLNSAIKKFGIATFLITKTIVDQILKKWHRILGIPLRVPDPDPSVSQQK
jgi:hypothetical protein